MSEKDIVSHICNVALCGCITIQNNVHILKSIAILWPLYFGFSRAAATRNDTSKNNVEFVTLIDVTSGMSQCDDQDMM